MQKPEQNNQARGSKKKFLIWGWQMKPAEPTPRQTKIQTGEIMKNKTSYSSKWQE
jgi:hypothetical protein